MERLILKDKVLVSGPNYWGKDSYIEFIPYEKNGWYWETPSGVIPISFRIAQHKFGRITLCDPNSDHCLNIYEHIGVLRFLGIDNVLIRSSRWPPYDGCASLYYENIKEYLIEEGEVEWKRIHRNSPPPNEKRHTCIFMKNYSDSVDLEVDVVAGWAPLKTRVYSFSVSKNQKYIIDCLSVKAQGYPHYFYYPAFFLKMFFGVKIADNVTWAKDFPLNAPDLFLKHRVLDLLGGLSLYYHSGIPAGRALSVFGGHKIDLMAINSSFV